METRPEFIRQYSKESSPVQRDEVAKEIREERREEFAGKQKLKGANQRMEIRAAEITQQELLNTEQKNELDKLSSLIETMSSSAIDEELKQFKLEELQSKNAQHYNQFSVTSQLLSKQRDAHVTDSQDADYNTRLQAVYHQEAGQLLEQFYRRQKFKWENSPYTKEDVTRYFSEENLAKLGIEDYATLLKRFPGELVTHVTRQGIRDHVGHMHHSGGIGAYSDGFMRILENGRLQSSFDLFMKEGVKLEAVGRYLHLDQWETEVEALSHLDELLGSGPGSLDDALAVHTATEEVADYAYGSERGNEIFIVFPSAHIASQHFFKATLTSGEGAGHNDQWIFTAEGKGLDINAGIVFLPAEANVDPRNGSRYQIGENQQPIVQEGILSTFHMMLGEKKFQDFITDYEYNEEQGKKCLSEQFGITDGKLQDCILSGGMIHTFKVQVDYFKSGDCTEEQAVQELVNSALLQNMNIFVESRDTVPSKEFWETYFNHHPEQRPSKIVYYQGDNPTEAVRDWKQYNGIGKRGQEHHLGFPERQTANNPDMVEKKSRFRSIAQQVIEDYYSKRAVGDDLVAVHG